MSQEPSEVAIKFALVEYGARENDFDALFEHEQIAIIERAKRYDAFAAQAVAAHAREPDEATVERGAQAMADRWVERIQPFKPELSIFRDLLKVALAAIGPGRSDRDAVIEEIARHLERDADEQERRGADEGHQDYVTTRDWIVEIRSLKSSPEKPPAPTPPDRKEVVQHRNVDSESRSRAQRSQGAWDNTKPQSLEAGATPPAAERAKPAASDDMRARWIVDSVWLDVTAKGGLRKKIVKAFESIRAEARREAEIDMRERQIEALRGKAKAESRQGHDGDWAARAANWLACDDLPVPALPLTSEGTSE